MSDTIVYDTFFNPPPPRDFWEQDDSFGVFDTYEEFKCPVCGAPYQRCMDVMFQPGFATPYVPGTQPNALGYDTPPTLEPSDILEASESLEPEGSS